MKVKGELVKAGTNLCILTSQQLLQDVKWENGLAMPLKEDSMLYKGKPIILPDGRQGAVIMIAHSVKTVFCMTNMESV